jgi:hypothetical protein
MILKLALKYWYIIAITVLSIFLFIFISSNAKLQKEVERQTQNVEVLNSNYLSYKVAYNTKLKTIHGKDSIINLNVAKVQALTYTVSDYKKYEWQDAQTIQSLRTQLKYAQNASNISTQTITNTVTVLKDSCFNQTSKWQDISGCIKSGTISIKSVNRDSLLAVISTKSKHNFLFFHWGEKITDLNVISKNPNTQITGVKFTVIKH